MTDYTTEEIKEHRKEWVAALRSGKYKQAVGKLKKTDEDGALRYCCLGVACDLVGLKGEELENGLFVFPKSHGSWMTTDSLLPREAMEWLGVDVDGPSVYTEEVGDNGESEYDELAQLNDNGYSFDQIAALIEEQGLVE